MEIYNLMHSVLELGVTINIGSEAIVGVQFGQSGIAEILDYLVEVKFPTHYDGFDSDYHILKALVAQGVTLNTFILAYESVSISVKHQVEDIKIIAVVEELKKLMPGLSISMI